MLTSTIVSLTWIIFLLIVFLFFVAQYRHLRKIAKWPVTEGKVTHFNLKEHRQTFWPKIAYQYEVNGITHESDLFFPDTAHRTPQTKGARRVAYDTAQAYLNDQPVVVHYNPHAPDQAVLDVKIPRKLIAILIILACLMATEILILLV